MIMVWKGETITSHRDTPGGGSGGAGPDEKRRESHFEDIITENETVYGSLRNPSGITRIKDGDRLSVDQCVVTLVTDRRILFTTPGDGCEGVVSLEYEEVSAVSIPEQKRLQLRTAEGIGLDWPLTESMECSDGIVEHLRWIGTVRERVRRCRNDIDLAAGEIRSRAESLDWEEAREVYRDARNQIDELCNLVYTTEPIEPTVLTPELTAIERTLEAAYTRLYIERTRSQLDLGRQLVENEDYEQARKVLQQTQEYYDYAREREDTIQRGDAFQFGAQRDIKEELDRLGWKIEAVAAEPLKMAHEAKINAQMADETVETLGHWERAFERYGHVLTLEWGSDERNFTGDPAEISAEIDRAAKRLIDLHGEVADLRWNDGARLQAEGEQKPALQACIHAQEHLERAHELAAEFEPVRADHIGVRLEKMADAVMRMRNADTAPATAESESNADPEEPEPTTDSTAEQKSSGLPTASELAEMDTHHELTLSAEDLQVAEREDSADPLQRERAEKAGESGTEAVETDPNESDQSGGETPRQ